jgi:hypothetical protein
VTSDLERLTALFRELGAPEPEGWARSQSEEGFNQLHRYLFLRQAWALIVSDSDHDWMDREIENATKNPNAPFSGVGAALRSLLDSGANRQDLTDVIRGKQAELLFGLCYLLEDPALTEDAVQHVGWRLVETDEVDQPTQRPITGLQESVLETDPTGREMRPRGPAA